MKSILSILILSVIAFSYSSCNKATSQSTAPAAKTVTPEGLSWYAIDDLDSMKDNLKGKKVLVDMYTSWCGWCKVMDKKTFTDPRVVDYLNENFVLVKFNAEQKEPVTFKGESYEWIRAGRKGVNKLAMKMMSGRLAYPTMVYLDENLDVIKASAGYKKPDQLLADLQVL